MAIETVTDEKQAVGEAEQTMAKLRHVNGSVYIYNRLPKVFEKMYDGAVYEFAPHEIRLMPERVGRWFWGHSVISYEPVTGTEVRALVADEDPLFGVPYDEKLGAELIDRSLSQPVTVDGLKLQQRIVSVKGGGFDKGKKIEKETARV